jgi:hypothetical protein
MWSVYKRVRMQRVRRWLKQPGVPQKRARRRRLIPVQGGGSRGDWHLEIWPLINRGLYSDRFRPAAEIRKRMFAAVQQAIQPPYRYALGEQVPPSCASAPTQTLSKCFELSGLGIAWLCVLKTREDQGPVNGLPILRPFREAAPVAVMVTNCA